MLPHQANHSVNSRFNEKPCLKKSEHGLGLVAIGVFNFSTRKAKAGGALFKASLFYTVSSRSVKRYPVSKEKKIDFFNYGERCLTLNSRLHTTEIKVGVLVLKSSPCGGRTIWG